MCKYRSETIAHGDLYLDITNCIQNQALLIGQIRRFILIFVFHFLQ